ncbi:hypothetical protein ACFO0N_08165 [Halobium salinum]|uniref:Uncharacterized protein n=1 Tax=Halobium salinum TaxID=1364940 RepID=A0ABD5PB54_9EURY|nr:hypothetical protein [Halobium salinum]
MRANGPSRTNSEDWPRYTVKCTRGAEAAGLDGVFDDDEVVLFDPTRKGSGHWLSATARTAVRVDENL